MRGLAVIGTTIAMAGSVSGIAEAAPPPPLNGFGPHMSHDLNRANAQLDQRLRMEGPNGCAAMAIAEVAGIRTAKGREEYITPENVDFTRTTEVTNKRFPINTGVTPGCKSVVQIPNKHSRSAAGVLVMQEAPPQTLKHRSPDGRWELDKGVLRFKCGVNALLIAPKGQPKPKPRRIHEGQYDVPVSFGILQAVVAVAPKEATSTSSDQKTCPDGTKASAESNANAKAVAWSAAILAIQGKAESFRIKSSGMKDRTYAAFVARFGKMTIKAELAARAFADATATSSATVSIECAPAAVQPPITPSHPPTEEKCPPAIIKYPAHYDKNQGDYKPSPYSTSTHSGEVTYTKDIPEGKCPTPEPPKEDQCDKDKNEGHKTPGHEHGQDQEDQDHHGGYGHGHGDQEHDHQHDTTPYSATSNS